MKEKRILIVDDDAWIRERLANALSSKGYRILVAADGSEAVSITRQQRPDLIVLDLIYPPDVGCGGGIPWDGFLILDWLHRLEEAQGIPVFFMTMGDARENRSRAFARGAAAFFQKPIEIESFLSAVQSTLESPVAVIR